MDVILSFKEYLSSVKRYSKHTVIAYITDVEQFNSLVCGLILSISRKDVKEWIIRLHDSGVSTRSITRKIHCLRTFYKFCLKNELIDYNPMQNITTPKFPKKVIEFIPENIIVEVLDNLEIGENRKLIRDKLLLELLYYTGCRIDEIINIRISDICLYKREIKVKGKNNKERLTFISKGIAELIISYNQKWKHKNKSGFLLVDNTGSQIYPMFVQRTIDKYFPITKVGFKVSPHIFRHTFASHLINKGVPIFAIKDLLGHATIASTEVYTHIKFSALIDMHKRMHPKG
ncbi:MAG: tyrosine-type recombinase/integrase [Sporocytophaga sp.]|uniref:tyrosine-type recombinase/integrase n=1 Tax=Sporocytophaga sp. TaxID=2231183 RepID=UPI001B121E00|nr:tyrosine-type recombinase/integrase [Sporocytophaga sp.]MBO9699930.1 tyrosine-type recombinase/integrase [Sporocytophaga sp.]